MHCTGSPARRFVQYQSAVYGCNSTIEQMVDSAPQRSKSPCCTGEQMWMTMYLGSSPQHTESSRHLGNQLLSAVLPDKAAESHHVHMACSASCASWHTMLSMPCLPSVSCSSHSQHVTVTAAVAQFILALSHPCCPFPPNRLFLVVHSAHWL